MTCSDAYSLTDCTCGFAEELFEAGTIQCADAQYCPDDCPVCSTCLDLLCGVPGKSPIKIRPLYWLYIVIGAATIFFTCIFCYYTRYYRANKKSDLHDSLLHKAVVADKNRVAPLLVTSKGTSTFQPPMPPASGKGEKALASDSEEEESVATGTGSADATAPTVDETTVLIGGGSIVTAPTVVTREESTVPEETSTQLSSDTNQNLESIISEESTPLESNPEAEPESPEEEEGYLSAKTGDAGDDHIASAAIISPGIVASTEEKDKEEEELVSDDSSVENLDTDVDDVITEQPDAAAAEQPETAAAEVSKIEQPNAATVEHTEMSLAVDPDGTNGASMEELSDDRMSTPFVGDVDETADNLQRSSTATSSENAEKSSTSTENVNLNEQSVDGIAVKQTDAEHINEGADPVLDSRNQKGVPIGESPTDMHNLTDREEKAPSKDADAILQTRSIDEEEAITVDEASSNENEDIDEVPEVAQEEDEIQEQGTTLMADTTIMAGDSVVEDNGVVDPDETPSLPSHSLVEVEDLEKKE